MKQEADILLKFSKRFNYDGYTFDLLTRNLSRATYAASRNNIIMFYQAFRFDTKGQLIINQRCRGKTFNEAESFLQKSNNK